MPSEEEWLHWRREMEMLRDATSTATATQFAIGIEIAALNVNESVIEVLTEDSNVILIGPSPLDSPSRRLDGNEPGQRLERRVEDQIEIYFQSSRNRADSAKHPPEVQGRKKEGVASI